MTQRRDDASKKTTWQKRVTREGDGEQRRRAYFYAQGNPICQLLGDGELLDSGFFYIFPKNKDGEEK